MARRDDKPGARFGATVLQRLMPLKPPFLLVDRVRGYELGAAPRLWAERYVSAREPALEGHYVGMPVLPGSLLLESLAQACGVLTVLVLLARGAAAQGLDEGRVAEALRNLERRERLDPGYRPGADVALVEALDELRGTRAGLLASTHVKFVKPVFGGDRVELELVLARELGDFWHFEVEALVDGAPVLEGTLAYAMVSLPSVRAR